MKRWTSSFLALALAPLWLLPVHQPGSRIAFTFASPLTLDSPYRSQFAAD